MEGRVLYVVKMKACVSFACTAAFIGKQDKAKKCPKDATKTVLSVSNARRAVPAQKIDCTCTCAKRHGHKLKQEWSLVLACAQLLITHTHIASVHAGVPLLPLLGPETLEGDKGEMESHTDILPIFPSFLPTVSLIPHHL